MLQATRTFTDIVASWVKPRFLSSLSKRRKNYDSEMIGFWWE